MEQSNNVHSCDSPDRNVHLHVSNIQLLASIDSALALVTLIFNLRQVITAIANIPSGNDGTSVSPNDVIISSHSDADASATGDKDQSLYFQLLAGSVASLCLTLTQLLLACLVMVSLSYISGDTGHDDHIIPRRARVISGIWVVWSGMLLIVLVVYVVSMKRFKDFSDKFYLFMLVSESVLRLVIINYTTLFFCCRCTCKCR